MSSAATYPSMATSSTRSSGTGTMLVWLLIMATLASFRHRHASELWDSGGIDWQVKFQAGCWLLLGLLAVYQLLTGRADLSLLRRGALFWFSAYAVLALTSVAYSLSPLLTVYRSLQVGVAIVLAVSLRDQLDHLYRFVYVYIAVNWILVLLPILGLDGGMAWIRGPDDVFVFGVSTTESPWRFASAFGHPSQISVVAGSAAVGLAARTRRGAWSRNGWLIVWLVVTTLLTISRTGIAGMLGGLFVVALGRRRLVPWLVAAGVILPLLFCFEYVQDKAGRYLMRGQTIEQFASLTGRDQIYSQGWARAIHAWPLGMGFQAGRVKLLEDEGLGGITHSHNVFLESMSGMGAAGLIVSLAVFISLSVLIWQVLQRPPPEKPLVGWELAGMFVPVVAFCLMDRGFATAVDPFLMFFLAYAALCERTRQEAEVEPTQEVDSKITQRLPTEARA